MNAAQQIQRELRRRERRLFLRELWQSLLAGVGFLAVVTALYFLLVCVMSLDVLLT